MSHLHLSADLPLSVTPRKKKKPSLVTFESLFGDLPIEHRSKKEAMCKVTWCNTSVEEEAHWNTRYCRTHRQYITLGRNATTRPWLFYRIEKTVTGELKCENCGYDAKVFHPDRPLAQLSGLFDVDHIVSDLKHTPEGEQPSNYQLLCKQCHALKSIDEGDYISKNNR